MKSMLLLAITLAYISCGDKQKEEPKLGDWKSSRPPVTKLKEVKTILPNQRVSALIKLENTIYHCSSIEMSNCGLNAKCGAYTLQCLTNYDIQQL